MGDVQITVDFNVEPSPIASKPVYYDSIEPIYLGNEDIDNILERPVVHRSIDYRIVASTETERSYTFTDANINFENPANIDVSQL